MAMEFIKDPSRLIQLIAVCHLGPSRVMVMSSKL